MSIYFGNLFKDKYRTLCASFVRLQPIIAFINSIQVVISKFIIFISHYATCTSITHLILVNERFALSLFGLLDMQSLVSFLMSLGNL